MKVKVVNNRDKKPINKEILIILIAVFSVLLLTVGFSAFKETLYINGMFADVRIPADIRVTGISVNGNTSSAISNSENYDVKSIVGNITLPQSDSSITYKVQITNFQGPEMGIFNLTGLPDNLDYELKDYTLKEKICNNDKCSLGVQKEILITIKYKNNMYNSNNTTFNFQLDFDFRSYHKVTYQGFKSDSSYPKEIMDGDNLSVTFNETVNEADLYVTVGGVNNTSYNLSSTLFTLNDIKDDVVIINFKFKAETNVTQINFPRTTDTSDVNTILTTEKLINITIKNNDGTNFNQIDGTYKVEVINSGKFELQSESTRTIKGGTLKDESISLNLHIKNLEDTSNQFKLRVTTLTPVTKTFEFNFTVTQDGAIQYIEDLVDMALAIRGRDNPKNLTPTDIQSQRFKLTRNLDFENNDSYKDPNRTDYGDVNGNKIVASSLKAELTSDTGFLPIGELDHKFKGTFNGGEHTLSNLQIHKSLQTNIGFFGTTEGATIKNITFANGAVTNENQTAGMVVGKVIGGTLDNITVSGTVISTDEQNMTEDTYSGGIAGYVTAEATISNCINRARVSTEFNGDPATYSGPAGGITAWMAHSTIINCKNYGEVTGESYIGGIAGFSGMQLDGGTSSSPGGGKIENCENHGKIHYYNPGGTLHTYWGRHIGGIAGYNKAGGTINKNTNASDAQVIGIKNVGGIVGNNASGGIVTNNVNQTTNISGNDSVGRIVGSGTAGSGNTTV